MRVEDPEQDDPKVFNTFYEAKQAASKELKGHPAWRVKQVNPDHYEVELWPNGPRWTES